MRYVLITDDPVRVRRVHGNPTDWTRAEFRTAAEALAWEREQVLAGAVPIESQGWRFGGAFTEERCTHSWVSRVPAA